MPAYLIQRVFEHTLFLTRHRIVSEVTIN